MQLAGFVNFFFFFFLYFLLLSDDLRVTSITGLKLRKSYSATTAQHRSDRSSASSSSMADHGFCFVFSVGICTYFVLSVAWLSADDRHLKLVHQRFECDSRVSAEEVLVMLRIILWDKNNKNLFISTKQCCLNHFISLKVVFMQ